METNFFAGKYQGNGKHNGNTVPSKANGYGEIRIGELVGELKLRDYDKNKVTIDKKYIREVKDKLASIGEYAESVVNKSDYKLAEKEYSATPKKEVQYKWNLNAKRFLLHL